MALWCTHGRGCPVYNEGTEMRPEPEGKCKGTFHDKIYRKNDLMIFISCGDNLISSLGGEWTGNGQGFTSNNIASYHPDLYTM